MAIKVGQGPENVFAVPYNHLKRRFIEFTQLAFGQVQRPIVGCNFHAGPWNMASRPQQSRILDGQEAEN